MDHSLSAHTVTRHFKIPGHKRASPDASGMCHASADQKHACSCMYGAGQLHGGCSGKQTKAEQVKLGRSMVQHWGMEKAAWNPCQEWDPGTSLVHAPCACRRLRMFDAHPDWTSSRAMKATTVDVLLRILIATCKKKQTNHIHGDLIIFRYRSH